MTRLRLVVGLGNPGPRYADTRHNAGFLFVDALATRHAATFRHEPRLHGEVALAGQGEQQVWLLKPMTYMNLSGAAVAALAAHLRLAPADILVAHDDIDLSPGTVRVKRGGGTGGHNGLRDVTEKLASPEYVRLRIGVGHPGVRDAVLDYVLERAPADEQAAIEQALARVETVWSTLMAGDLHRVMNELNRRARRVEEPHAEGSADEGS